MQEVLVGDQNWSFDFEDTHQKSASRQECRPETIRLLGEPDLHLVSFVSENAEQANKIRKSLSVSCQMLIEEIFVCRKRSTEEASRSTAPEEQKPDVLLIYALLLCIPCMGMMVSGNCLFRRGGRVMLEIKNAGAK